MLASQNINNTSSTLRKVVERPSKYVSNYSAEPPKEDRRLGKLSFCETQSSSAFIEFPKTSVPRPSILFPTINVLLSERCIGLPDMAIFSICPSPNLLTELFSIRIVFSPTFNTWQSSRDEPVYQCSTTSSETKYKNGWFHGRPGPCDRSSLTCKPCELIHIYPSLLSLISKYWQEHILSTRPSVYTMLRFPHKAALLRRTSPKSWPDKQQWTVKLMHWEGLTLC